MKLLFLFGGKSSQIRQNNGQDSGHSVSTCREYVKGVSRLGPACLPRLWGPTGHAPWATGSRLQRARCFARKQKRCLLARLPCRRPLARLCARPEEQEVNRWPPVRWPRASAAEPHERRGQGQTRVFREQNSSLCSVRNPVEKRAPQCSCAPRSNHDPFLCDRGGGGSGRCKPGAESRGTHRAAPCALPLSLERGCMLRPAR